MEHGKHMKPKEMEKHMAKPPKKRKARKKK